MILSVIVPTFREAEAIASAVAAARTFADEVIVVDGGSTDDTMARARDAGARVLEAAPGRGAQLAAGAAAARGDVLLFLHADVRLPLAARAAIEDALADPRVGGGNFALRFVPASPAARFFGWANHVRRRWLRTYYGDSAIFVRRGLYEGLGGFAPIPLFEDYDFVRRLERSGPTAYVVTCVAEASARRFEARPVRTLALWTALQVFYSVLRVSPATLAKLYAALR